MKEVKRTKWKNILISLAGRFNIVNNVSFLPTWSTSAIQPHITLYYRNWSTDSEVYKFLEFITKFIEKPKTQKSEHIAAEDER